MRLFIATFVVVFILASCKTSKKPSENLINPKPWTLVVIPDTQHFSQNRRNAKHIHMLGGFDWIVENRDKLNIKFVQGLGDITESWANKQEWDRSFKAWDKLEGKVDYMPALGNHDDPATFNRFFPIELFRSKPHYLADSGSSNNVAFKMDIAGDKWVFLSLQSYTQYQGFDLTGINWAEKMLGEYPDRMFIIATHDNWDTRIVRDRLVNKYDNIVMVNAGHTCVREKYFKIKNAHNFIADYQCDGWERFTIRYYTFYPDQKRFYSYTYHYASEDFERDHSSQGIYNYSQ